MSTISGKIFPNTQFPDAVQELPRYEDLSKAYEEVYSRYINALLDNDFIEANKQLELLPDDCMINAYDLNVLSDTINAVQTLYSDTSVFEDIINKKQNAWNKTLNQFEYKGEWIVPVDFSNSISYNAYQVVYYKGLMWRRTNVQAPSDNPRPMPQDDSQYWEPWYRRNMMFGFTSSTGYMNLYLAVKDVDTKDNPETDFTRATIKSWANLTLIGERGSNGQGFTFKDAWSSSSTYSLGDLVIYNNECYSSLKASNSNHNPSTNDEWWKKEFDIKADKIPVQAEAPTEQEDGDIWFQLVALN